MDLENRIRESQKRVREVLNERGKEYGDFKHVANFAMEFVRNNLNKIDVISTSPEDYHAAIISLMMLGVKLARLESTPTHEDSLLDFFGYLELLENLDVRYLNKKFNPNEHSSPLHKHLIDYVNDNLKASNAKDF